MRWGAKSGWKFLEISWSSKLRDDVEGLLLCLERVPLNLTQMAFLLFFSNHQSSLSRISVFESLKEWLFSHKCICKTKSCPEVMDLLCWAIIYQYLCSLDCTGMCRQHCPVLCVCVCFCVSSFGWTILWDCSRVWDGPECHLLKNP